MTEETRAAPLDGVAMIAEAITEHYGEQCSEYEPGCPCCDVWAAFRKAFPEWQPKP